MDIDNLDGMQDNSPPSAIPRGRYRHYKGGEYDVLGTVRHSETEETLVLYRPCYGARELWVRPLAMFTENVVIDGETRVRFGLIS